mmetsp:Transcript_59365/g.137101  ORF Transcript_59365/g.137101 Transcript_59365/m.137101 type:complete len:163 (+) Transcript_59365:970-1458(+)
MRQDEHGDVHRLSDDEFKVHVGLIVGGIAGAVVGVVGSICVYVFWPTPWPFCHDGLTVACRPCPAGASCSDGTMLCDPGMRLVDSVCIPESEAGSFAVEAARAVALKLRRLRGEAQCNDTLTAECAPVAPKLFCVCDLTQKPCDGLEPWRLLRVRTGITPGI